MTRVARPFIALLSLALGLACAVDKPPEVVAAEDRIPEVIDFALHVRPILSDRCYKCHGPDANQRKAGLRFDTEDGPYAELPESPGDSSTSASRPRIPQSECRRPNPSSASSRKRSPS